MVSADRADQFDIARAAHAGHLSSEPLCDLHGERPHASRGADDQDLLFRPDMSGITKALQCCHPGQRYGCRLLECQIGRFQLQEVLRDTRVLGKATRLDVGEDLITRTKPTHGLADRLDLPGQITTQNTMLWCAESVPRQADGKARQAPQEVPITRIGGGCADAYQYFIVPGCWLVDFLELENVRRTVAVADDCLHGRTVGTGWLGCRCTAVAAMSAGPPGDGLLTL